MKELTEKISLWQLFILIFIFEMGSGIIVGIGNDAKQDAWIAIAIATLLGVLLVLFFSQINSRVEGKNLFEIFEWAVGKWVGRFFICLYVLYFIYIASRVLRDFGELISSSILPRTPIEVTMIIFMLVVSYVLYLGLEVLARTGEIFLPYVIFFMFGIGFGVLFSGEMHFENLLPILPEGIGPVAKAIFPSLLTFPFGELIVFTLIFPYVSKAKYIGKVSIASVLAAGLLLVYSSIIQITTLGSSMKSRANFPLLSAAGEISLLEFIERIDLLIVFIMMFGVIIKVAVFTYGGLKGLELIFLRPYRYFIFPISMLIAFLSVGVSGNFAEHIEEGLIVVPYYLHLPFQLGIPLLLFPIILWKTKVKKGGQQHDQFN
ncbi:spore germination protein KB [Bacillus mesophilus]|uniref:Endospore germination permease n=1 Tax=Bacillus mesophilus TaxID=1808955 RepID=A0A6M0QF23_9BACI|nr:endospore germination permease [Bacillus mesophilus]MBM7663192.1 spore germination protein KB [Bacillus mesophilus]NEY73968.1 endospore germination permease [Bacillus mesophilus]